MERPARVLWGTFPANKEGETFGVSLRVNFFFRLPPPEIFTHQKSGHKSPENFTYLAPLRQRWPVRAEKRIRPGNALTSTAITLEE